MEKRNEREAGKERRRGMKNRLGRREEEEEEKRSEARGGGGRSGGLLGTVRDLLSSLTMNVILCPDKYSLPAVSGRWWPLFPHTFLHTTGVTDG